MIKKNPFVFVLIVVAGIAVLNVLIGNQLIWGMLSLFMFFLSASLILPFFNPATLTEYIVTGFLMVTGKILIAGYLLSFIEKLNSILFWFILSVLLAFLSAVVCRLFNTGGFSIPQAILGDVWARIAALKLVPPQLKQETPTWKRVVLWSLLAIVLAVNILNLQAVLFAAPHNNDSLAYHAARAGYYVQHGHFGHFQANFWAQNIHPKNSPVFLVYAFLTTGHNENMMQMVQFICYWIAMLCIYGISRRINIGRAGSLLAALSFGLLTEVLLQAGTTQNDLIVTAYCCMIVYNLFSFKATQKTSYLFLTAMCTGIAMGTKASFLLVFPSLFLLFLYVVLSKNKTNGPGINPVKTILVLAGFTLIALAVFALPSGYIENINAYDHPIGPENVRKLHSFEGVPLPELINHGVKNFFRFSIDFLSLDGMPRTSWTKRINRFIRSTPTNLLKKVSVDLNENTHTRRPFLQKKVPRTHEDHSYYGILGFGLILPCLFLVIVGLMRSPAEIKVLSYAFLLFLLTQAFCGPYDPWRGRYFIIASVFAVPVLGFVFQRPLAKIISAYIILILAIGSYSAFYTVILRENRQLIDHRGKASIFSMNRIRQITAHQPKMYKVFARFNKYVPQDASVGLVIGCTKLEYPFFGEKLTRKLYPIRNIKKIPNHLDYLVFKEGRLPRAADDLLIGEGQVLRKLR